MGVIVFPRHSVGMFSSKPKFTPGVPFEVQRVYDLLNPKPKELLHNAGERRFISEGEIGVFNHKERRTKRRYLYLFNDVLLVTKKEGKKSYWLKIYISLGPSLRVEDVPDTATKYKVEFRIYALKKTIILFTRTEDEKHRWLQLLRDCIANKKDEDEPPAYAPDSPVVASESTRAPKEEDIHIADVTNYGSFEHDQGDEPSEEFNPELNSDAQDIQRAEKPRLAVLRLLFLRWRTKTAATLMVIILWTPLMITILLRTPNLWAPNSLPRTISCNPPLLISLRTSLLRCSLRMPLILT